MFRLNNQNIADERASRLIDRDLMKTSLSMLSGLGVDGVAVYEEDFENDFLATTRAFYRAESQVWLVSSRLSLSAFSGFYSVPGLLVCLLFARGGLLFFSWLLIVRCFSKGSGFHGVGGKE